LNIQIGGNMKWPAACVTIVFLLLFFGVIIFFRAAGLMEKQSRDPLAERIIAVNNSFFGNDKKAQLISELIRMGVPKVDVKPLANRIKDFIRYLNENEQNYPVFRKHLSEPCDELSKMLQCIVDVDFAEAYKKRIEGQV